MRYFIAIILSVIVFFIFDYGCGNNLPIQNAVVVDKHYIPGHYQIHVNEKGLQTMTWIEPVYEIRCNLGFNDRESFYVSSDTYKQIEIGDEVKATQREGAISKIHYNVKLEKY